ncbi:endodeoxyribonuclease [Savitreella phatthalungensis]
MLQTSSSPTVRATPFFCLVDYDPHGVDILFNYRFGSRKRLFEEQGIPSLRWLGMHWSDVVEAKPHQQVRLIEGEREVLKRLLERPQAIEDGALLAWRRELHRMRMNDIKAEIEIIYDILSKRGQTLDSWLVGLIQQRRFY